MVFREPKWTLALTLSAQKDITKLDNQIVKEVLEKLSWLESNFNAILPRRLSADLSDFYKLRIGDYRAVYDFNVRNLVIKVYKVEHRSKVYKKK